MSGRMVLSLVFAAICGTVAIYRQPFPDGHPLLELVRFEQPVVFHSVRTAYLAMLFTTPFVGAMTVSSTLYIFAARKSPAPVKPVLPPYPEVSGRTTLSVVVGEVHHAKRPLPVARPSWLSIPERGLYTGIMVLGAIGTGKTSACMMPFAEQILGYRASDRARRIGGLVLEVKGDFCHRVRQILERHGRGADYVEVSLGGELRYNPLHNDLDAYALAFGISSLLNNLYGKGREPFWQQAYTNLVKFVILLHRVLDGYVTFFDIYQGAINREYLERRIKEGESRSVTGAYAITFDDFMNVRALEDFPFEREEGSEGAGQIACDRMVGNQVVGNRMVAPVSEELRQVLETHHVPFTFIEEPVDEGAMPLGSKTPGADRSWTSEEREQFEAVRRWFYQDWQQIDARLRTSIVEGIAVFLSLFDDNPAVKRVFCPPKDTYDPVKNAGGRYGRPLAPFADLIEAGQVCALNFPVSANPGLARVIGTLMKLDFERAVLNRIPKMEEQRARPWREVLFLCDEYHSFATVGENDPTGDEKFFALARQAKCISVVATQSVSSLRSTLPGESWRTLLQTFRTKVFLALSDDASARTASELCGKEEMLRANYTISEQGQDAGVSVLTGRAAAHRASIGATKGYSVQRDFVFEPKVFAELKNAQAIVLAYDGASPLPPTYCYLKPYYLDPNVSYFEHVKQGVL